MRPKGIKAKIRELAGDDGDLYILELHKIATGQNLSLPPGYEFLNEKDINALIPTVKERLGALELLVAHLHRQPPQSVGPTRPDKTPLLQQRATLASEQRLEPRTQ